MGLRDKASKYKVSLKDKAEESLKPIRKGKSEREKKNKVVKQSEAKSDKSLSQVETRFLDAIVTYRKEIYSFHVIEELFQKVNKLINKIIDIESTLFLIADDEGLSPKAYKGLEFSEVKSTKISYRKEYYTFFSKHIATFSSEQLFVEDNLLEIKRTMDRFRFKLVIPIITKKGFIGLSFFGNKKDGTDYSDTERELLVKLIDMTSSDAMYYRQRSDVNDENQHLKSRIEEITKVSEYFKTFGKGISLREALRTGMEMISSWFEIEMSMMLLRNARDVLYIAAAKRISTETRKKFRIENTESTFHKVMNDGSPVFLENYLEIEEVYNNFGEIDLSIMDFFFCVPLVAMNRNFGLMIFMKIKDKENKEQISDDDISIYSYAASQMAAPILLAKIQEEERISLIDPYYHSLVNCVNYINNNNIHHYILFLLTIDNYNDILYIHDFYLMNFYIRKALMSLLHEVNDSKNYIFRYKKDRILILIPDIAKDNVSMIEQQIQNKIKEAKEVEALANLETSMFSIAYPDDGEELHECINKLEKAVEYE